ncbi:MAG: hypothetical protein HYZ09_01845 [Candidatus Kerfeldbacteria bacterium]|nr:hypothetical protein [Candidatus Kerfeldbacteria bacterium]
MLRRRSGRSFVQRRVPRERLPTAQPPRRIPGPLTDLAVIVTLGLLFLIVSLLPPFRLSAIEVSGTKRLRPEYVVDIARQLMGQRRLGILPKSSYFYFDPAQLQEQLTANLQQFVPLDGIIVTKRFPRFVAIAVRELEPAAILVVGDVPLLIDAHGTLTGEGSEADVASLPTIEETNAVLLQSGDQALAPSVTAAVGPIRDALTVRGLDPITFATPQLRCPFENPNDQPLTIEPQPIDEETAGDADANTNLSIEKVLPAPAPIAEQLCDLSAALKATTELEVRTGEGWRVHLDTSRPFEQSLDALFLALNNKLRDRTSLHRIDLRFLPRLYYQ